MGNSLREELLKAGLAAPEQRKKTRRRKSDAANRGERRKATARRERAGDASPERPAAGTRHVLRENQRRSARFIRDATLSGASVEENAKKALRRRIEAHVESERLNDAGADIAYHFVKGKRIKRIYVTEAQRARLGSGELVIAALEGNHHLMSAQAAERLKALAPQTTVCACAGSDEGTEEYPVPDDITW